MARLTRTNAATRLNLVTTPDIRHKIEQLKIGTNASSLEEVVRHAIMLYEFCLTLEDKNAELYYREKGQIAFTKLKIL